MKHTAATSPLLTVIKRQMNSKVYKHALSIYNTAGPVATLDYMDTFINEENRAKCRARLEQQALEEAQRQSDERSRCFRHLIR